MQSSCIPAKRDLLLEHLTSNHRGSTASSHLPVPCLNGARFLSAAGRRRALHGTVCSEQAEGIDHIFLASLSDRELQMRSNVVNASIKNITEGVALSESVV